MSTAVEFVSGVVESNFHDPDLQTLFKNSGLSEADFKSTLANGLVAAQSYDGNTIEAQARGLFPIHKTVDLGVAKLEITISNPSSGTYIAAVDSYIVGIKIGHSELKFENGQLSRHESIGNNSLGGEYTVDIQISGGFKVHFYGKVWVHMLFVNKEVPFNFWLP